MQHSPVQMDTSILLQRSCSGCVPMQPFMLVGLGQACRDLEQFLFAQSGGSGGGGGSGGSGGGGGSGGSGQGGIGCPGQPLVVHGQPLLEISLCFSCMFHPQSDVLHPGCVSIRLLFVQFDGRRVGVPTVF